MSPTESNVEAPEEAQDYATGWRPKAGDEVAGKVIDITATDGGYGVYPIVTLEVEGGGEVAIHAFHTVLRRELARRRPKIGDKLDITYLGKRDGKPGTQGYDAYRVKSDKDVVGYDWDSELSPEERANAAPVEPDVPIANDDLPEPVSMEPDTEGDVPF